MDDRCAIRQGIEQAIERHVRVRVTTAIGSLEVGREQPGGNGKGKSAAPRLSRGEPAARTPAPLPQQRPAAMRPAATGSGTPACRSPSSSGEDENGRGARDQEDCGSSCATSARRPHPRQATTDRHVGHEDGRHEFRDAFRVQRVPSEREQPVLELTSKHHAGMSFVWRGRGDSTVRPGLIRAQQDERGPGGGPSVRMAAVAASVLSRSTNRRSTSSTNNAIPGAKPTMVV